MQQRLFGRRHRVLRQRLAEFALVALLRRRRVAQRHVAARHELERLRFGRRDVEVGRDLLRRRRVIESRGEVGEFASEPAGHRGELGRQRERATLAGQRVHDGLSNPPHRVGDELDVAGRIEPARRLEQAEVALVDQVEEADTELAVPLRVGDDEAEVGFDEALERLLVVVALDADGEFVLLGGCQARDLRNLLQVRLQGQRLRRLVVRRVAHPLMILPCLRRRARRGGGRLRLRRLGTTAPAGTLRRGGCAPGRSATT